MQLVIFIEFPQDSDGADVDRVKRVMLDQLEASAPRATHYLWVINPDILAQIHALLAPSPPSFQGEVE